MAMPTSRANVEDIYESQNDQRLDELHTKLQTLRGVLLPVVDSE
jgi:blocked-early-in-transport protein 1